MLKRKKIFPVLVMLLLLVLAASCGYNGSLQESSLTPEEDRMFPADDSKLAAHVPSQILVGLEATADEEQILSNIDGEVISRFKEINALHVQLQEGASITDTIKALEGVPGIRYAQPNYIYQVAAAPDDPSYVADEQWGLERINAEAAWDITAGSSDVVIAVLDTGVDVNHEDLAGKVLTGDAYNATNGTTNVNDVYGHGTHVAGIAAGIADNETGIAGIAWGCPILPVKVLTDSGSGTDTMVGNGIIYTANWADTHFDKRVVINMSLGGIGFSSFQQDAIEYALAHDVVVVAAMGNDSRSIYSYPAAFQGVIAVGATNYRDEKASFSTTGSWISISAPGEDILSTVPYDGYERWDGTSMATPFVTGAAALVLSEFPELTPAEVKNQLEQTADDLGAPGFDNEFGFGRLNLARAVDVLQNCSTGTVAVHAFRNTDDPIAYANVILYDNEGNFIETAKTNDHGVAMLRDIPAGVYYVTVSIMDFYEVSDPFVVNAGDELEIGVDFGTIPLDSQFGASLTWIGNVDMDLIIEEPDGNYHSAYLDSLESPNGIFNKDAVTGSESPETYELKADHQMGYYSVLFYAGGPGTIHITITWFGGTVADITGTVSEGGLYYINTYDIWGEDLEIIRQETEPVKIENPEFTYSK
ncbi:MAG: S8 family serine peptidase [Halanaerobium sp.]|nr:S8 family serine peptidase [Halanaerobium sp.]